MPSFPNAWIAVARLLQLSKFSKGADLVARAPSSPNAHTAASFTSFAGHLMPLSKALQYILG